MKNADTPANPVPAYEQPGLTKREHFCLQAGVPATGDDELDAIIREGERRRMAGKAMAAYVSGNMAWTDGLDGGSISPQPESVAAESINYADALLAELEKGEG